MLILGITGGIATGKSVVTHLFSELGAPTLSADAIAHALLRPGTEVTRAVLQAFPLAADTSDPEGMTVDRRALGQLVFADSEARHRLEALTHPPIRAALRAQIALWRSMEQPCAAAVEIPLLFESHLETMVDKIVVTACADALQLSRLMARGLEEPEARRRLAAQWPLAEKVARADYVITTDGSLEETLLQVQRLWAKADAANNTETFGL